MSDSSLLKGDEYFSIRDNRLFVEDCDAVELSKKFGTPLFVVSENKIRSNFRRFHHAFASGWGEGEVIILPAIKACPIIAARKVLSQEGAGCDTFGESELEGALRGDCAPEKISVNGSVKDTQTISRAIELGSMLVLDSPRELAICEEEASRLGRKARVLFRLKPYLEGLEIASDFSGVPIRESTQRIKYGIPTNEVEPMGPLAINSPHVDPIGYHCHIGRQSADVKVWAALVTHYVALIADLRDKWGGWTPRMIDFGGGFPPSRNYDTDLSYNRGQPVPSIDEIAQVITSTLRDALKTQGIGAKSMNIAFEPGRALFGDAGIHLTKIVNLKSSSGVIPINWAETDTSEFFFEDVEVRPDGQNFRFVVANKANAEDVETFDIVGKSCGAEKILVGVPVPALAPNDVVAFIDTGSYHETQSRNFNAMPRPGTILVNGTSADWIKRPETIDDVYRRDIVPAYLA